jgi:hypothetical protein
MLPQQRQPAPWPELAWKRPAADAPPRALGPVDIAGKLKEARGASAPQPGQEPGSSYSDIGR